MAIIMIKRTPIKIDIYTIKPQVGITVNVAIYKIIVTEAGTSNEKRIHLVVVAQEAPERALGLRIASPLTLQTVHADRAVGRPRGQRHLQWVVVETGDVAGPVAHETLVELDRVQEVTVEAVDAHVLVQGAAAHRKSPVSRDRQTRTNITKSKSLKNSPGVRGSSAVQGKTGHVILVGLVRMNNFVVSNVVDFDVSVGAAKSDVENCAKRTRRDSPSAVEGVAEQVDAQDGAQVLQEDCDPGVARTAASVEDADRAVLVTGDHHAVPVGFQVVVSV